MLKPIRMAGRAAGACAFALALLSPAQAAPVVEMTAAPSAIGFDLTVYARDVADLVGWQFTLQFDPALLRAAGVAEGSFLASGGATYFRPGDIDAQAGTVDFNLATLIGPAGGVSGSGDLARFSFDVRHAGLAGFTLSDVMLLDAGGAVIDAEVSGLLTAVPEPTTWLLFAFGLAAVLGARRLTYRTRP